MKPSWVCACQWPRTGGARSVSGFFFFFYLRFCEVGSSDAMFGCWRYWGHCAMFLCFHVMSFKGRKYQKTKNVSCLQIHYKKYLVSWGCLSCLQIISNFIYRVEKKKKKKKELRHEIPLVGCFENRYHLVMRSNFGEYYWWLKDILC